MEIARVDFLDEDKLESKHGVRAYEVLEIMRTKPRIYFQERGKRKRENLYAAYGQTENGRYLVVFFIYKLTRVALVMSAREMDESERKRYARK